MAIAQSQTEEPGDRQQKYDRNDEGNVVHLADLQLYATNEMPREPDWMHSPRKKTGAAYLRYWTNGVFVAIWSYRPRAR